MMMNFSFGYEGNGEEVGGKCSCEGMRGLCDWVASGGSRCIGNGCNFLGNVLCGNRRGRMILQMRRSGGGDDRVLEERRIHQDDGRCLRGRSLVRR